jgi:hypothetical protein
MNNQPDNIPDTTSPEDQEKRKRMEEFQARLKKVLEDSGIPEAKDADDDNESPQTDS